MKEVSMSFIAALLTFLFFCHPGLLAFLALIIAIVLFATSCPGAFLFLLLIAVGVLVHKLLN